MKNLEKFLAVFFVSFVLLASVTGCSARTPVSADQFQKQAKALGYTLPDSTSSGSDVIQADKSDSKTSIIFYSFDDASSSEEKYRSILKSITPEAGGGRNVDSDAYNKYVLTIGELYYTVVRMDNTVIFCKATIAHKDEVDQFVQTIKY